MMAFQSLILVLGFLLGLALKFAMTASEPLWSDSWLGRGPWFAVSGGAMLAMVMFAGVWLLSQRGWAWLTEIQQILDQVLIPSLRKCRYWQLLVLAMLAGIGEELLFRWAMQGWFELGLRGLFDSPMSLGLAPSPTERWAFAGAILLTSIVFGLCHAITRAYCALATMMGLVFSGVVVCGGGLVGAMIAHGLYDFLAFVWLCRRAGDLANADLSNANLSNANLSTAGAESEFRAG
ncbi:MAG: CPBP family intramembrane metalloprotease [Planctomycetaceae bacterium]|nr:CPBP family intramembrane metalloprotease [Planctomycetaceae bacterium]